MNIHKNVRPLDLFIFTKDTLGLKVRTLSEDLAQVKHWMKFERQVNLKFKPESVNL